MKEMSNVQVAFELKERNAQPPIGYKHIPMKMIFDKKLVWLPEVIKPIPLYLSHSPQWFPAIVFE